MMKSMHRYTERGSKESRKIERKKERKKRMRKRDSELLNLSEHISIAYNSDFSCIDIIHVTIL